MIVLLYITLKIAQLFLYFLLHISFSIWEEKQIEMESDDELKWKKKIQTNFLAFISMSILSYFNINSSIKWKLIDMVMSIKTLLETALVCRSFFIPFWPLTLSFLAILQTNQTRGTDIYIGKMFGQVVLS